MIKKHILTEAFPEFDTKIHSLKVDDEYFKKLYETYAELDKEVYKIESNIEPASDEALNALRLERVRLKDEIYQYLTEN